MIRPIVLPIVRPVVRGVAGLFVAFGRMVWTGDYLLDEAANNLTDELGNRITG